MRRHLRVIASRVRPGDRVLYVGPRPDQFFDTVDCVRPSSRHAMHLGDPALDRELFDVVVLDTRHLSPVPGDLADAAARLATMIAVDGSVVFVSPLGWGDLGVLAWPSGLPTELVTLVLPSPATAVIARLQGYGYRLDVRPVAGPKSSRITVLRPPSDRDARALSRLSEA